jgi:hypothetical protein
MQKFNKGDKVKVADDLGSDMKHFQSGVEAIVIASYSDQFGGSDTQSYTIYIKGQGEVSWYYDHQMELIETGCYQELEEWRSYLTNKKEIESDIDWIFMNGPSIVMEPSGYSIQTLFNCICKGSLWGSSGEGITYYDNSQKIILLARPFLELGDKEGWLKLAESYKV